MGKYYTDEELENILLKDFIEDGEAFGPHRRNDDVVDAMCICFALDKHFFEDVWEKHAELHGEDDHYYQTYVLPHVERAEDWLYDKENSHRYKKGEDDIMCFAINH